MNLNSLNVGAAVTTKLGTGEIVFIRRGIYGVKYPNSKTIREYADKSALIKELTTQTPKPNETKMRHKIKTYRKP